MEPEEGIEMYKEDPEMFEERFEEINVVGQDDKLKSVLNELKSGDDDEEIVVFVPNDEQTQQFLNLYKYYFLVGWKDMFDANSIPPEEYEGEDLNEVISRAKANGIVKYVVYDDNSGKIVLTSEDELN
jgi:hypothetical protein